MGDKQVLEEADQAHGGEQQWTGRLHIKGAWQWGTGNILTVLNKYRWNYVLQKDFKEISKSDEIDKKTLAKIKKNAACDADILLNIYRVNHILHGQNHFDMFLRVSYHS